MAWRRKIAFDKWGQKSRGKIQEYGILLRHMHFVDEFYSKFSVNFSHASPSDEIDCTWICLAKKSKFLYLVWKLIWIIHTFSLISRYVPTWAHNPFSFIGALKIWKLWGEKWPKEKEKGYKLYCLWKPALVRLCDEEGTDKVTLWQGSLLLTSKCSPL